MYRYGFDFLFCDVKSWCFMKLQSILTHSEKCTVMLNCVNFGRKVNKKCKTVQEYRFILFIYSLNGCFEEK
jgi:hypothetical protein